MKRGAILVNIGSPEAPTAPAVRRYLGSFLSDPRILGMPAAVRVPLVYGLIAPLRASRSAHAYAKIWTPQGSPLTLHGQALAAATGAVYATRYGRPSLDDALDRLGDTDEITVLPLYPQYAAATTASTMDALGEVLARRVRVPAIRVVPPFWAHPGFLDAAAAVARPVLEAEAPERVLFSYHGLPESQVRAACDGALTATCCDGQSPPPFCYRAQCLATTRLLAARLGIDAPVTTFQSRLGPAKWIGPATLDTVLELARSGVKRVVVLTPSFVADCLETLEELGVSARDQFVAAGGERLVVAPCVNTHPRWVEAVEDLLGGAPRPS